MKTLKLRVIGIIVFLGFLSWSVWATKAMELKTINELPLIWTMPFDSCVQDVVLSDRGLDPQLKAVQTEKAVYFYDKGRNPIRTVPFELIEWELNVETGDWERKNQNMEAAYTLQDWINCNHHGYLTPDGKIVVKFMSESAMDGGYGIAYNEKNEEVFTQPFSGKPLLFESCLVSNRLTEIVWHNYRGEEMERKDVGFGLDHLIPYNNTVLAIFDNEIRRYDLKGELLWRSVNGKRRADVCDGCDKIITWREVGEKTQLVVLNDKGEIEKQIDLAQKGDYAIRVSKDGSHALAVAKKVVCYCDLKNEKSIWNMDADVSGTELAPFFTNKLRISDDNKIVSFKAIMPGRIIGEQIFVDGQGKIILRYPLVGGYFGCDVFELLDNGRLILFDEFMVGLKLVRNPAFEEQAR